MTSAERATLIGLVEVTQRTEEFAQLRYLSGEEVAEVLSNTGGTMAATEAVQYIHVAQGVNLRR